MRHLSTLLAIVVGFMAAFCLPTIPADEGDVLKDESTYRPRRIDARHLPNALWVQEKVLCGGLPESAAAFEELKSLGVKTIISVDGATPNVELAKLHGLRYVHLPHGYDGISESRGQELAKAVRSLPGPIYIHCHHGKHRSPAAAAVACVAAGLLPAEDGLAVLQEAGTSKNYRGLYACVAGARRLDEKLLDELQVEFHDQVELPPLAQVMVAMEDLHDRLVAASKDEWRVTSERPDNDPAHDALLLKEHFTELLRLDDVRGKEPRFLDWLRESEVAAEELQRALGNLALEKSSAAANSALERISSRCTMCHREYRDLPLGR